MRNCVLILLFISFNAFAQSDSTGTLSIQVHNDQKLPVENATIELRRANDSILVKTSLSAKDGIAEFFSLVPGTYYVKITSIQHDYFSSPAFLVTNNVTIKEFVLAGKKAQELQTVTVTSQKPFIQKLTDRLVVNVENSIVNAGSTALEVLERSPGVIVDHDAISLRGKNGVIIMIDGKVTPLSGADLINYLRGLPSGAIESIHLITNPSARYEAAGNSGIIDIRMKKDQRLGLNGSFTVGYGQGVYPKENVGTTFNYRNKKVNIFGNYNNSRRKDQNELYQQRVFFNNGLPVGSDNKDNIGVVNLNSHAARLGADYFPSKNTVVGLVATTNFSLLRFSGNNISRVKNEYEQPIYYFNTLNRTKNNNSNHLFNINLKHNFAASKELTFDADYGVFTSNNFSRITSLFYHMSGSSSKPKEILDAYQTGNLQFKTARADYTNQFKKAGKFEAGLRTSYVAADNDAKFFNVFTNGSQIDPRKTNHFYYNEYNNAGYVNYSRENKKTNFQLGLRGEQTNINTRQVVKNIHWDSSYFQLFPSAFFNFKIKENKTLGVSLSRRIDRPGYGLLNPFIGFIDATAYTTGNPQLLPQLSWTSELSYTLKNNSFSFTYSRTTNPQYPVIGKVLDLIPDFEITPGADSNITVQKFMNLDLLQYYSLTATAPIKIKKWWNSINNLNIFYNHVQGSIGGSHLDRGDPTIFIRSNNSIIFKKDWSAELNGSLLTGRRSGYLVSRTRGAIDAGVQKKIMKGAGTLRFNVTDILLTNIPIAVIRYQGHYAEDWYAYRDTRVFNFSFIYRFGNNKVQAERKRTTASEEERKRAGQ